MIKSTSKRKRQHKQKGFKFYDCVSQVDALEESKGHVMRAIWYMQKIMDYRMGEMK